MSPAAPSVRSLPEGAELRELVPLRPQGPVELVDRATHLLRARSRDLVGVAVVVQLAIWLVLAIVLRETWAQGLSDNGAWFWSGLLPQPVGAALAASDQLRAPAWKIVLGQGLPSLGLAVTGAACGALVQDWSRGRASRGLDALAAVARRAPELLALWAIVHAVELLTVVGALAGPVVLGISAPLLMIEGAGPIRTIRRSVHLSTRGLGSALATVATSTGIAVLAGLFLAGAPIAVLAGVTGGWVDLGGTAVTALASAAPRLVLDPVIGTSMALLALDLLVRVDALDLELALAEVRGG